MGGVIVHNDIDVEAARGPGVDLLQELQKFGRSVSLVGRRRDCPAVGDAAAVFRLAESQHERTPLRRWEHPDESK